MTITNYATADYTADGVTADFTVPFDYLSDADLNVTVNGVVVPFTIPFNGLVTLSSVPAAGAAVRVFRTTSHGGRLVDYASGASITEADLDTDSTQSFFMAQEAIDLASRSAATTDGLDVDIATINAAVATCNADVVACDTSAALAGTYATNAAASAAAAADKAPLNSPAFTGTPTAPTATAGTNTTQLATTAFVAAAVAAGGSGVTSFNTRTGAVTLSSGDVTGALGFTPYSNANPSGYITSSALSPYATLASPALTGTPTAPTATGGTNTTQIATTAFVTAAVAGVSSPVTWSSGNAQLEYSNSQRTIADDQGWATHAHPVGGSWNTWTAAIGTTSVTLSTSGNSSIILPMFVPTHMLLEDLIIWNSDASGAHAFEWRLYRNKLNNGNSGENTVDAVTGANGTFSYTPSAADTRTSTAATPGTYLAPGVYFLVLRNTSGSVSVNITAATAGVTGAPATHRVKNLGSALGTTLDIVTSATAGSSQQRMPAVALRGRVAGMPAVYG